jgi:hypothetical protein
VSNLKRSHGVGWIMGTPRDLDKYEHPHRVAIGLSGIRGSGPACEDPCELFRSNFDHFTTRSPAFAFDRYRVYTGALPETTVHRTEVADASEKSYAVCSCARYTACTKSGYTIRFACNLRLGMSELFSTATGAMLVRGG